MSAGNYNNLLNRARLNMEAQPLPVIPEAVIGDPGVKGGISMTGLPSWCICTKGGFDSEALPVGLDPRIRGDAEKKGTSHLVFSPRRGGDRGIKIRLDRRLLPGSR